MAKGPAKTAGFLMMSRTKATLAGFSNHWGIHDSLKALVQAGNFHRGSVSRMYGWPGSCVHAYTVRRSAAETGVKPFIGFQLRPGFAVCKIVYFAAWFLFQLSLF